MRSIWNRIGAIGRATALWLPIVGALGGGVAWLWKDIELRQQESRTRLVEARRPFLEKQLQLYFESVQVAGKLVSLTPDDAEWAGNERRFWALYWSELAMVEDKTVAAAMVSLGNSLKPYIASRIEAKKKQRPFDEETEKAALAIAALGLGRAVGRSIEDGWAGARTPMPTTP